LDAMSQVIHADGGLWVAPAAPGFDATDPALGGTTVVDRKDGETLRTEYATALNSNPDMIGIISWNEFSENSHVEPSYNYGCRYLEVLADLLGAPPPECAPFDLSGQQGHTTGTWGYVTVALLVILLVGSIVLIGRRPHGSHSRSSK